jgi:MoxR-like ATPase
VTSTQELEQHLQTAAGAVVFGATGIVRAITVALVMRGHILLQGVPGVGKTRLSKRIAAALGGTFQRIQGTADLMPSDITGVHVFDRDSSRFQFRPGPVFADVVLVDEINRAGPKTQSALLEAMQERQVTVDRDTMRLPGDFLVIATQNPHELEGTYPLPESQLDRFLVRVEMSYPDATSERRALEAYGRDGSDADPPIAPIDRDLLERARQEVAGIEVSDALHQYVLAIAAATRESRRLTLGLSTRGALALLRCARVTAAVDGETYVTPDHVQRVVPAVINHRVMLAPEAMLEEPNAGVHVREIVSGVAIPR